MPTFQRRLSVFAGLFGLAAFAFAGQSHADESSIWHLPLANMHSVLVIAIALIVGRLGAQLWLGWLNRRHVRLHASAIPEGLLGVLDDSTYGKSVEYTLSKSRFGQLELLFDTALLLLVLVSGFLPWWFGGVVRTIGSSSWAMAAFLFSTGLLLSIPNLPWEYYAQFVLEARFGFNNTTLKLWLMDRVKGVILSLVLGYPLLLLILKLVDWIGPLWWLWSFVVVAGFQLLMMILAPIVIMPLFNKFTPLPDGPLRDRLLALGKRTGFQAKTIQVMDGSRRSNHSNAFFTGFGRFRKIVLFDTLIAQLTEAELEAVLAHEIGHYRRGHIPKMLVASLLGMLLGFYVVAWFAGQPWFVLAFGLESHGSIAPSLLIFALLSGTVSFWFTPISNMISRKFEYQADAYAAQTMTETSSLIGALRKLNEKNLSNLCPHPLFSGFYYSHPTLFERENALRSLEGKTGR